MKATRRSLSATTILGLCLAATTAAAQRGAVSDFSGAGVASSAMLGPFGPSPVTRSPNVTLMHAALGDMAFKVGVSLDAGTVAGGGFTTTGRGVQAVGRLMLGSTTPDAAAREAVARAFRSSGASPAQVDRLVSALAGLLMNSAASLQGDAAGLDSRAANYEALPAVAPGGPSASPSPGDRMAMVPRPPRAVWLPQNLSAEAVDAAAAAFNAVVNSASAAYLRNPPEEFQAVFSTLYELLCAENTAAGAAVAACAPPTFVVDQPPPQPLVNQDSIDAAEAARTAAAAARLRADSIAAAAARAHADSLAAAARAVETSHARAALETRIFFDQNQFSLDADAKAALDAKLLVLQANPSVRIRVEGNVDEQEKDAFNRLLGRFRAEQARSYLIAHGISVNRIDIVNNGSGHPVCSEHRESCWSRNRRDEFVIVAGGNSMQMPH